jgi:hypothetical protein
MEPEYETEGGRGGTRGSHPLVVRARPGHARGW